MQQTFGLNLDKIVSWLAVLFPIGTFVFNTYQCKRLIASDLDFLAPSRNFISFLWEHLETFFEMQQPATTECRPYFFKYINLVAEGDIIDILLQQADETREFFNNIPAGRHDYRYAEDKWSVKQVLMHIIDTERVMSYRALVAARGDTDTKLYNMDENLYADNAPYANRTMQDILEEFSAVRTATVKLFANVTQAQSEQPAYNVDGSHFTTRALAYIIAGHLLHHLNIIKERYL